MKVSLNWLREYVDIELSPTELAELLTRGGLEVEAIEQVGEHLEGVVVAQIISITPHPQADRLSLCTVTTGKATYSVVCGAANIKQGDKVPFALPGTVLPGGVGIKKEVIRGVESEGVLCSEAELGLSTDSGGVMIIPVNTPLGEKLADALAIRDHLLEVSVTPNRGDCLSMIGVAREVAALTGKRLRVPRPILREVQERIEDMVSVELVDPDLCPRYTARLISEVKIAPSPFWLRLRLERAGIRSINNVVDVTNYVMLEYGQPLHAFDFDLLEGGKIMVRRVNAGETFRTLDGVDRTLPPDALMICDAVKPVAIGGIMGGVNSEISAATTRVLLESAYFTPGGIRRTSLSIGLSTESSYRFERGIDPEGVLAASDRAASLIAELAQGRVAKGVIDCYPAPIPRPVIRFRLSRAKAILGIELKDEEVKRILEDLQMELTPIADGEWSVRPPSWRGDCTREIDLIEEVARLKGYEEIPVAVPKVWIKASDRDPQEEVAKRLKSTLVSLGFFEVITYSFIAPASLQALRLRPEDPRAHPLPLLNPLGDLQSVMRTTLIPGLLDAAIYNLSHKNRDLKIFELREVFITSQEQKLPWERRELAGLLMGNVTPVGWNNPAKEVDFYYAKGCVERLLSELKVAMPTFTTADLPSYLTPGKGASVILGGKRVGAVGQLQPDVADRLQIPCSCFIFEFDIQQLASHYHRDITFIPLPRYPSVTRDVAVTVDRELSAQQIAEVILGVENRYMESVEVFDYYQGDPIPQGKKGLAYRITYRAPDRTLTDEEANAFQQEVIERLKGVPGLTIR